MLKKNKSQILMHLSGAVCIRGSAEASRSPSCRGLKGLELSGMQKALREEGTSQSCPLTSARFTGEAEEDDDP